MTQMLAQQQAQELQENPPNAPELKAFRLKDGRLAFGYRDENGSPVLVTEPMERRSFAKEMAARAVPAGVAGGLMFNKWTGLPIMGFAAGVGTARIAGETYDRVMDHTNKLEAVADLMGQPRGKDPALGGSGEVHDLESAQAYVDKIWDGGDKGGHDYNVEAGGMLPPSSAAAPMETWWPGIEEGVRDMWPQLQPQSLQNQGYTDQETKMLGGVTAATETFPGGGFLPMRMLGAASAFAGAMTTDPTYVNEEGQRVPMPDEMLYNAARARGGVFSLGGPIGYGAGSKMVKGAARAGAGAASGSWDFVRGMMGKGPHKDASAQEVRDAFSKKHLTKQQRADVEASKNAEAGMLERLASAPGGVDLSGQRLSHGFHVGRPLATETNELSKAGHSGLVNEIVQPQKVAAENYLDNMLDASGLGRRAEDALPTGVPAVTPAMGRAPRDAASRLANRAQLNYNKAYAVYKPQYSALLNKYKDLNLDLTKHKALAVLRNDKILPLVSPTSEVGKLYHRLLSKISDPALRRRNAKRKKNKLPPEPAKITGPEIQGAIRALRDAKRSMGADRFSAKNEIDTAIKALEDFASQTTRGAEMVKELNKVNKGYRQDVIDRFRPHNNRFVGNVLKELRKAGGDASKINQSKIVRGLIGKQGEINPENYLAMRRAVGAEGAADLDGLVIDQARLSIMTGSGNAGAKLIRFIDKNDWLMSSDDIAGGSALRQAIFGGSKNQPAMIDELLMDVAKDESADMFRTIFREPTEVRKWRNMLNARYGTKSGTGDALLRLKASNHIMSQAKGANSMFNKNRAAIEAAFDGDEAGLLNLETLSRIKDNISSFDSAGVTRGADVLKGMPGGSAATKVVSKMDDAARSHANLSLRNIFSAIRQAMLRIQSPFVTIGTFTGQVAEGRKARNFLNAMFDRSASGAQGAEEVESILKGDPSKSAIKWLGKLLENDINRDLAHKTGIMGYDPSSGETRAERQTDRQKDINVFELYQREHARANQ